MYVPSRINNNHSIFSAGKKEQLADSLVERPSSLTLEDLQKCLAMLARSLDSVEKLIAIRNTPEARAAKDILMTCIKLLASDSNKLAPLVASDNTTTSENTSSSMRLGQ